MLTAEQVKSLQPVIQGSSALSIVGSMAIIATYIFVESFRRPSNRLVFWVSCADFCAAIFMFLAAWPITTIKVQAVCTIQGWGITYFLLCAAFWTACLALQCLLAIRKGSRLEKLVSLEKWFHAVSWTLPFIITTTLLFIGDSRGPVFTDATFWCWIGNSYGEYRFYFFYMWLWAIFLWNLTIYAYVGYTLWSSQKRVAKFARGSGNDEPWQPSRSMRIYVRKTSFFILAFFINWFWGTLNRIQNMVEPGNSIYALFLLHAIFTPLQGFLNFVAYFLVHYLFKASTGNGPQPTDDDSTKDSKPAFSSTINNTHDAMPYSNQDLSSYLSGNKQPQYTVGTLGASASAGPNYSSVLGTGGVNQPVNVNMSAISTNNQFVPFSATNTLASPVTPATAMYGGMSTSPLPPNQPQYTPGQPSYATAATFQSNVQYPQYGLPQQR